MADNKDQTKTILEELLSELYEKQSRGISPNGDSFLIAEDNQFLGKINDNKYDSQSIKNTYGPFGSRYSTTSIFNPYSPYGSKYGIYSLNNPYTTAPPRLFVNNKFLGVVSANKFIHNRIANDIFLLALEKNINSILQGAFPKDEQSVRTDNKESFIIANDGTYLGSLNPNSFDQNSIFNTFGPYGSEYSQTSIFNRYSQYGGEFSSLSPFNKFSSTPPKVFLTGKFIALLTVNNYLNGEKIDPNTIKDWAKNRVNWNQ